MLSEQIYLKMHEYNVQATTRILDKANQLTPEQLVALTGASHGALQPLLLHTLRTEWIWRTLSNYGQIQGRPPFGSEQSPDLTTLRSAWQEEDLRMQAHLENLDEAALAASVPVLDRQGNINPLIRWQMLQHRFLHSMQHRSEAAGILTGFGQSPGDLDFIYFV